LYRKWAQSVIAGHSEGAEESLEEARDVYPNPHRIAGNSGSCAPLNRISEAMEALARTK
jgi:hypothetical protein